MTRNTCVSLLIMLGFKLRTNYTCTYIKNDMAIFIDNRKKNIILFHPGIPEACILTSYPEAIHKVIELI